MTKAELLAYCGDSAKFPFFGGWVAPQGNNPTVTVNGVVLDVMPVEAGDAVYRAYYRRVVGINADTVPLPIRVVNDGTPQEAAYLMRLSPAGAPASTTVVLLRDLALSGRRRGWWARAKAEAAQGNEAAIALFDYYDDIRNDDVDMADPAVAAVMSGLIAAGAVTEADVAAVHELTQIPQDFQ